MRYLTLVRHAKSRHNLPGLTDLERPLAERGERDAPLMGQRCLARGLRPTVIVTSPAVRAYRTAELLAAELNYPASKIQVEDGVYTSGAATLLKLVRRFQDAWEHVLLVGHNPTLTDAVNAWTDASVDNVPTMGVAAIQFEAPSWSSVKRGTLRFFDYPKNTERPPQSLERQSTAGCRVALADALGQLPGPHGERFASVVRNQWLEIEIYAPRGFDPQEPHTRNEIYWIQAGRGTYVCEGERVQFGPGDLLFAAAGAVHRFEEFTDDLVAWVLFYGPERPDSV